MLRVFGRLNNFVKKVLSFILAVSLITAAYYGATAAFTLIERQLHPIRYAEYVVYYSELYGVPVEVTFAVILTESKFNPQAVSYVGASGLMQLMPQTYAAIMTELEREPESGDIFDPETNIRCGVYLLSKLYKKYGDLKAVYAAYNAGESRVDAWLCDPRYSEKGKLTDIPFRETSGYVRKAARAAESYKKLYQATGY